LFIKLTIELNIKEFGLPIFSRNCICFHLHSLNTTLTHIDYTSSMNA